MSHGPHSDPFFFDADRLKTLASSPILGRGEVEVEHVEGDRWFGTWEARSLDAVATGRGPWRVEIRCLHVPSRLVAKSGHAEG